MKGGARLGCAALVGAAVAFPVGVMVGGRGVEEAPAGAKARRTAEGRNFYSPSFRSDPYVLEQQRRVVEALELGCRQFGERCREAAAARRRIEEME